MRPRSIDREGRPERRSTLMMLNALVLAGLCVALLPAGAGGRRP
jgi:hypothetical protein